MTAHVDELDALAASLPLVGVIDSLRDALAPPPPPPPLTPRESFAARVRERFARAPLLRDADLDQLYYLAHLDDDDEVAS